MATTSLDWTEKTVSVDSLAWSAETFVGPNLIGYGNLLEKTRFAVDPAENRFYMGA
jgi:hypothetical protein